MAPSSNRHSPGAHTTAMPKAGAYLDPRSTHRTGLVLSGGGARGAYEVGVMTGVVEVLGPENLGHAPFDVFCGTSVGAINAAWLAAHADRDDMAAHRLAEHWRQLSIRESMRFHNLPLTLHTLLRRRRPRPGAQGSVLGPSLVDASALELLVRDAIPWNRLHRNISQGVLKSLVVTALDIASGVTTLFVQQADNQIFVPTADPRRRYCSAVIGADHVLASAAIPLVFPARRVGQRYYCDGGLRFHTPIATAIRAGADRIMVVSVLFSGQSPAKPCGDATAAPHKTATHNTVTAPQSAEAAAEAIAGAIAAPDASAIEPDSDVYPHPLFLLGKVFNALLLDPVEYDIQILERFNNLIKAMERELSHEGRAHVDEAVRNSRGIPYRPIEALVFQPSQDLGALAMEYTQTLPKRQLNSWLMRRIADLGESWEADLLSFLLLDGGFASVLIDLGRRDVLDRAEEVRTFFEGRPSSLPPQ